MLFLIMFCQFLLSYSYDPPCQACRWFIPNYIGNKYNDYGLCKMYKNYCMINGNKTPIYNFAKHCRNDEFLCGKSGFLFEPIIMDNEKEEITNLLDEYHEINNRLSGEVIEKYEIDEIENDFIKLFEKVRLIIEKKEKSNKN